MAAAIDTNILVRFLTGDDPRQAVMAADQMRQGFILLPTVLMETEWVLRARYGWAREQIIQGLREVIDMPGAIGIPANIDWALDRTAAGADFADMAHLSTAADAEAFVTFDQRIERVVGDNGPVAVITLI